MTGRKNGGFREKSPRDRLFRKGLILEYFTVVYNIGEAALALMFGAAADSIALIGFGLDSLIESLSGGVLIWRLRKHGRISEEDEERIERKALRFVAVSFLLLGLYVFFQSARKLIAKDIPEPSLPGIILAGVSIIVMPLLTWQKYRTGRAIQSQALIADSKETLACALLSVALLLGLGMNYSLGFWQADPIAGMVIVAFLFREAQESWEDATKPD